MNVLGESRIWGISAVIKKEAKRSEGFSEGTTPKKDSLLNVDSPETIMVQLSRHYFQKL
jgi:hypothetical protein